jgi:hypothetical protein
MRRRRTPYPPIASRTSQGISHHCARSGFRAPETQLVQDGYSRPSPLTLHLTLLLTLPLTSPLILILTRIDDTSTAASTTVKERRFSSLP